MATPGIVRVKGAAFDAVLMFYGHREAVVQTKQDVKFGRPFKAVQATAYNCVPVNLEAQ